MNSDKCGVKLGWVGLVVAAATAAVRGIAGSRVWLNASAAFATDERNLRILESVGVVMLSVLALVMLVLSYQVIMFVVLVAPMVVAVMSVPAIAVVSVCLIAPLSYWFWRWC